MLKWLRKILPASDKAASAAASPETKERQAVPAPGDAEACKSQGNAHFAKGELDSAAACYRQALLIDPRYAEAYNNLGLVFRAQRRFEEATDCLKQAISIDPGLANAHYSLGLLLQDQGKLIDAAANYQKALQFRPDFPEVHLSLGTAFYQLGKLSDAEACFNRAIALRPGFAEAYLCLADNHCKLGKFQNAIDAYRGALSLIPDHAAVHNNLGMLLRNQNRHDEAIAHLNRAISINPAYAEAYNNLGLVLRERNRHKEAERALRQAISLNPQLANAHVSLGAVLQDGGQLDEAIECFRNALAVQPRHAVALTNLLLALNYSSRYSAEEIFREHLKFAEIHSAAIAAASTSFANERDPERRIRVGYVSADFRAHSVAYFFEPLLVNHDTARFEIFCYSNHPIEDQVTRRLKAHGGQWRNIAALPDEEAAGLIRQDGIDVLVDLAGHTGGNRLSLFARKPAPVQVTWLGYPNTTGLPTMDYRITDVYAEPEGLTDHLYTEKLYRLPEVFCGYLPKEGSPEPAGDAPAFHNGYVTFGSFNNFNKVSPPVVELWAKILNTLPAAKLLLEAPGLGAPECRQTGVERCKKFGIGERRLELLERSPSNQYWLYHRADICLDPFPCNGGTTSCDALWMGTPLVTLAGKTFVSRMGVSLLSNVGLSELIAQTPEEYLAIATKLATDLDYLREIRHGLRERVAKSPLLDMPGFTRRMEAAYREMWRKWCSLPPSQPQA